MRRAAPAGVSCQGAPGAWTHPCKAQPCVRQGDGSSQSCAAPGRGAAGRPASERCERAGLDGRARGRRHPSMLPCTATGARSRHWKVMRRMGARVVCSQRACARPRPGAAKAGRACAAARRRGAHRAGVTQCTPSSSIHTQHANVPSHLHAGTAWSTTDERVRADSVSHRAPPRAPVAICRTRWPEAERDGRRVTCALVSGASNASRSGRPAKCARQARQTPQ